MQQQLRGQSPYELHPHTHIISSKDAPFAALQRAGHADIVETPDGGIYLVHLAGWPIGQNRPCALGRETAIQEAYWDEDDWLYVKYGPTPTWEVNVPGTRNEDVCWEEKRYAFKDNLHKDFQWLRTPEPERIFSIENGKLVLTGRESICSWFEQSLVARRRTHFSFDAETVVDFLPEDERQFAGLALYYCRYNFFYLAVTSHSDGQRELQIMRSEASWPEGSLTDRGSRAYFVSLPTEGKVACSDLNGTAKKAAFDYFVYRPAHVKTDRYGM